MAVSTMKKLAVYLHRVDTDAIVRRLMSLRCVDVSATELGEGQEALDRANVDTLRGESEKRLARIADALPPLTKRSQRKKSLFPQLRHVDMDRFLSEGGSDAAWKTVDETNRIMEQIAVNNAELSKNELYIGSLAPWFGYDEKLNLTGTETSSVFLGTLPAQVDMAALGAALGETAADVETVSLEKTARYVSVVCLRSEEEETVRILSGFGFLRVNFKNTGTTARRASEQASTRSAELEAAQVRLEERLAELAGQLDAVETLYDAENTTLESLKTRQKLAETESCVVLSGWVPAERADRVTAALDKFECAYELSDPEEGEEPPVLLKNNKFATNFEWVLGMYSYPRYGTFDPTFIMSIFYFIIFGLMFADVGYGLILTVVCFLAVEVFHPKPSMQRFLTMFGYCGISCMIMGVIFGSYFGDFMSYFLGDRLILTFDMLEGNGPIYFLLVSLGMGAVHLIAGMAVQFVKLCKQGKALDAIFDIGSWWLIFAGLGIAFGLGMVTEAAKLPGYICLGLGLFLLVGFAGRAEHNIILRLGKGLLGIYNGVSYVSDLLSYSRIMALGLAAAVIAKVINQIGFMLGGNGSPFGFVAMILVFVIGHIMNMAINLLGTFVHTARLQYIEFFGKFYEDGGVPFRAAAPSEKYTTDAEPDGAETDAAKTKD